MNEKDFTVEAQMPEEIVQDDAAQAQEGETLESLLTAAVEESSTEPPEQDAPPAKEPGWVRGRVNAAVKKALATQAAELEQQFQQRLDAALAPVRDAIFDRQAEELVRTGEFKSLERAKEYVRLKGGVTSEPAPQTPAPAPAPQRDAQGRFTSPNRDSASVNARAEILASQVQKIKANRGVDVMAAFNGDAEVRQKVISGEWDFHDVADHLSTPQRRTPTPMRNPNGAGVSAAATTIANMTDAQFARLEAELMRGRRFDVRDN